MSQPNPDGRKRDGIVIAAIFKNENAYLREWIEFHLLVGISHFYLYDNDGGDEAKQLLEPYVDQGLVTRTDWTHLDGTKHDRPTPLNQRDKNHMAFAHAAWNFRDRYDWIMKIDIDEFLVPLGGDSIPDGVAQYDRSKIKGIRIPRINFGDSGHEKQPEGLVIEAYSKREAKYSDHKDLGNSRFISSNEHKNSAHSWGYRWFSGGRLVRESKVTQMRVHHYYTKSLEEYMGRQNTMQSRPLSVEGFREKNAGRNDVEDDSIVRFAPAIKAALAQR